MRTLSIFLIALALACLVIAQSPITVGGNHSSGFFGIVQTLDWYNAAASGCTAGSGGACVGHALQGDQYNFTAWLPSAAGLPKTSGLPVVGTMDDYSWGLCAGNLSLIQLDVFSWSTPLSSHVQSVNCMSSYGTAGGAGDRPVGWWGALTSGDGETLGTWKNWQPLSKGGILYLPIRRVFSPGVALAGDASFIISTDSGAHWCNVYTYWHHSGSPGCDSSNWDANGDAPHCDAATSSSDPCLAASYTDATHSTMMWKPMPAGLDNWSEVNFGYQDCTSRPCTGQPTNVTDGCDPATYICFLQTDGSLARVNLVGTITGQPDGTDIMDVSKWKYYTCSNLTLTYQCPSSDPANWTTTLANRTRVFNGQAYGGQFSSSLSVVYGVAYIKEFGSYVMTGQTAAFTAEVSVDFLVAPRIEGPWTTVAKIQGPQPPSFFRAAPALGYTVVSSNPPEVEMVFTSNNYLGGAGSPVISKWDLVLGRVAGGEQLRCENLQKYVSGACYKYSTNIEIGPYGTMPSKGLVYSFDYLDVGAGTTITNYPYFVSRTDSGAVIKPCEGFGGGTCGAMNSSHGTSMNGYGAVVNEISFIANFHTFAGWNGAQQNAPAMSGNGTYSVVSVFRYDGSAPGGKYSGIWSTGTASGSNNTAVQYATNSSGNSLVMWNGISGPAIAYGGPTLTSGNWVFTTVTVAASTGGNCPLTGIWWGASGSVSNVVSGGIGACANFGASSNVPAVTAAPLYVGVSVDGWSMPATHATTLLYDRVLSDFEIRQIYTVMKSKMAARGATLQ